MIYQRIRRTVRNGPLHLNWSVIWVEFVACFHSRLICPLCCSQSPITKPHEVLVVQEHLEDHTPSAQMGMRRSERQLMMAKAPASTVTANSETSESIVNISCSPFDNRFRLLPQFDHGNYKSPTLWPAFGADRERQQSKKQVSASAGATQAKATKTSMRNGSGGRHNGKWDKFTNKYEYWTVDANCIYKISRSQLFSWRNKIQRDSSNKLFI